MFVDQAIILIRSGRGGDGKASFRREKYIPKGGPDGGDGGRGGHVVIQAKAGLDTLLDFAGRHHWDAEDGQPGGSRQMHGRDGQDLLIAVPPGTLVYDDQTGELIVDLDHPGASLMLAEGGKGGLGNEHFKSSTNQTPTEFTPGEQPVERRLRLELKLIADVGLIGKPNAGKSTLLSRISRARPKIADYPFTTLEPNLGIAELSGHRRLVVADIPGLIEGAHRGLGLGTRFLRHIERTRLLVHLLEWEPTDGSTAMENYRVIRTELASYSPALAAKPELVVLTKIDLLANETDRRLACDMIQQELGIPVLALSSISGQGLTELLEACWQQVGQDRLTPTWSE
ncbi:MAG: GTPase ObgE [Phycisphaeraceae bacterium]|nr:GTPase ObgE [Phycisphaeraceae bacterium]